MENTVIADTYTTPVVLLWDWQFLLRTKNTAQPRCRVLCPAMVRRLVFYDCLDGIPPSFKKFK